MHPRGATRAHTGMRPNVVGYGSSGRAPPNTASACFQALDGGADSVAVDICETSDGVLVVANRRTLRLLRPVGPNVPTFEAISGAALDQVFGPHASRHRVVTLRAFLSEVGGVPLHLRLDGALSKEAWRTFESLLFDRRSGVTTVVASPSRLVGWEVPLHVQRVAVVEDAEDVYDAVTARLEAIAASARCLPMFGRVRSSLVALECDTRSAVAAVRTLRVAAVFTERPAWLRCIWDQPTYARA